jgi:hypothetical protein
VQYKSRRVVLTSKILKIDFNGITMNQLDEVVIRRYNNINRFPWGLFQQIKRTYTVAERKYATTSSNRLNQWFDPLLNLISGKGHAQERACSEKKETYLAILDEMFDKDHINNFKIPLDYVRGFQYYAVDNYKFTRF